MDQSSNNLPPPNPMSEDGSQPASPSTLDIQAMAQQLQQQQILLQQLLQQQQHQQQSTGLSSSVPGSQLHDLPSRPSYEWQPDEHLTARMPTLSLPLFDSTLSNDEKQVIFDRYPPVSRLRYAPPETLPIADQRFNKAQKSQDQTLRQIQYGLSGILRPLDVLGYVLHQSLPQDQLDRVFAILHDLRLLVLHNCGMVNSARNQLALRVVNLTYKMPSTDKTYTMDLTAFKDTLSHHNALQKAIKEANPRGGTSYGNSFFRAGPSRNADGGHHSSGSRYFQQQQQPRRPNNNNNHRRGNNNNPFRNNAQTTQPSTSNNSQ